MPTYEVIVDKLINRRIKYTVEADSDSADDLGLAIRQAVEADQEVVSEFEYSSTEVSSVEVDA